MPSSSSKYLNMSDHAKSLYNAFWKEIEAEMRPFVGKFEDAADWASKLPAAVARIAGNLHVAYHVERGEAPGETLISAETMRDAISIGRALIPHALEIFGQVGQADKVETGVKHVIEWIKKRNLSSFKRRDCHQAMKRSFPLSIDMDPVFELLITRNFIRPVEPLPGMAESLGNMRISDAYYVNPSLISG